MARRFARLALDAALVTAVVVAVFIAYGVIGNRWYRVVAVASGSMEPALPVGSLIVITPPSDPLSVGSIITFVGDGRLVTHRIVEVRADGFPVTQGDANNTRDTFTNVTVVGRVAFSIPWLGFVLPSGSAAQFADHLTAGQSLTVGPLPDPAPTPASTPGPASSGTPTPDPAADPSPTVEPAPVGEPTPGPAEPSPAASPPEPSPQPTIEPTSEPALPTASPVPEATTATPPEATPSPTSSSRGTPEPATAPQPEPSPTPE